ncbi:transposase [Streptomyces ehimensis]|uniref:Transposase n=2 Tax=Streptomyces TaxID=1883 RepID=A0ABV9BW35_9ACTN
MAVTVTDGQRGDTPQSTRLMERIRVAGTGDGRPCTRPSRVIADRAYSSRAIRAYLRRRQIPHTTPEKRDQAGPAEPATDPQRHLLRLPRPDIRPHIVLPDSAQQRSRAAGRGLRQHDVPSAHWAPKRLLTCRKGEVELERQEPMGGMPASFRLSAPGIRMGLGRQPGRAPYGLRATG